MSSSAARPERVYHQDYIARIRYSNALPPPPNPPKLLDIPNTGLASGQYTSAGFASRLVRDQPLNIEADAELGMPIDLVGLPGVFDGDESGRFKLLKQYDVAHANTTSDSRIGQSPPPSSSRQSAFETTVYARKADLDHEWNKLPQKDGIHIRCRRRSRSI